MFEVSESGQLRVFDRFIMPVREGWSINTTCGPRVVEVAPDIENWAMRTLAQGNGQFSGEVIAWLNPHAARMLYASGTLTRDHVAAAELVPIKDLYAREEGYLCRQVTFAAAGQRRVLTVLVSRRGDDPRDQVSLLNFDSLEPGLIDVGRSKCQTKMTELI